MISFHRIPNICNKSVTFHQLKGTVYAPFLNNVLDEEIIKELSSQGVVSTCKFQTIVDDDLKASGVVNLYKAKSKLFRREYFPS